MAQPFNFNQSIEKKAAPVKTSNWWDRAVGDNKVRLLTIPTPIAEHGKYDEGFQPGDYEGVCIGKEEGCPACKTGRLKPNVRYLFWLIDRKDNQVKLGKLTYGVFKQIGKLQEDPEYKFSEMPMPYDINIKYDPTATPASKYTVVPSRNNSELTSGELAEVENIKPTADIVARIKEKKAASLRGETKTVKAGGPDSIDYPQEDISPDSIPF